MEYMYQLVAFIDVNPEPPTGTPIYSGPMGWIPNVAIKRRFATQGIDEEELIIKIKEFCDQHAPFGITFTRVIQPDHMPEKVIEIAQVPSIMRFHNDLIQYLGDSIKSRYPERDGQNYYPHMTISWHGERVIDPKDYLPDEQSQKTKHIDRICLVKDVEGENSQVVTYFDITGNS